MPSANLPSTAPISSQAVPDNQALISLAILKVNWDLEKKDYLENFVSIVAESVRLLPEDVVSLAELQEAVRRHFGIELAQNSLRIILNRAKRRGFVQQKDGAYYKNVAALDALNFRDVQHQVLSMHDALIREICAFSFKSYGVKWNTEEAEQALESYLRESGHSILAAVTQRGTVPQQSHASKSEKFIIASFVQHAQETHSASFAHLETIVKGSMLATAIFLRDPTSADRRFKNTQVFFDTSFLVFALGYAGLPRRDPCVELLNLLYETGADLRCFRHTLEELHGVLIACAHRIGGSLRGAYGPSIEYFLSEGYTASDIEFFANRLEGDLSRLKIRVVEKPGFVPKFVIDERGLAQALSNEVGYAKQEALDRDVASISAVMRCRGTALYFFVEECRAIFITTNPALVRAANEFIMTNATPGAVNPCMTDYRLTNLLWLKKPLSAPDLPKKRLIADCYAATQPDDHLWKKYLDEIEKLSRTGTIASTDVYLLRHSLEARTALMEKTLGDQEAFTQGTVPEILKLVRGQIEAKLRSSVEEEVKRRQELEHELAAERLKREETNLHLIRKSQKYAALGAHSVGWVLLLLLAISTAYSFPWKLPEFKAHVLHYLIFFAQALFLVLAAVHLFWGTTVKIHLRNIETRLAKFIEQRLRRIAGISKG